MLPAFQVLPQAAMFCDQKAIDSPIEVAVFCLCPIYFPGIQDAPRRKEGIARKRLLGRSESELLPEPCEALSAEPAAEHEQH